MWFIAPDKYIPDHAPFEYNGIQYDAKAMFDPALRAQLGAVAVTTSGEYKDGRLYLNSETLDGSVRLITNTPLPLDQVRASLISQYRSTASALLAQSDWEVVAAADTSRSIPRPLPEATATRREAIRAEFNWLEGLIVAATDISQLESITPAWPE